MVLNSIVHRQNPSYLKRMRLKMLITLIRMRIETLKILRKNPIRRRETVLFINLG